MAVIIHITTGLTTGTFVVVKSWQQKLEGSESESQEMIPKLCFLPQFFQKKATVQTIGILQNSGNPLPPLSS